MMSYRTTSIEEVFWRSIFFVVSSRKIIIKNKCIRAIIFAMLEPCVHDVIKGRIVLSERSSKNKKFELANIGTCNSIYDRKLIECTWESVFHSAVLSFSTSSQCCPVMNFPTGFLTRFDWQVDISLRSNPCKDLLYVYLLYRQFL